MEHARQYDLRAIAVLALFAALAVAYTAHALWRDPGIAWLSADASAPWIEYPLPPSLEARPARELVAEFRREFELESPPASAALRARGFRSIEVWINDVRVLPEPQSEKNSSGDPLTDIERGSARGDWKSWKRIEVAGALRKGANRVLVRVANATGPPALAFALEGAGLALASGPEWRVSLAGAAERPARLAGERTRPDSELAPEAGGSALASLRASSEVLVEIGLAILGLVAIGTAIARRAGVQRRLTHPVLPFGIAAGAWIALFLHNAPLLPLALGFDARGHLDYLEYLIEHHALPAAHAGWQMYQPPLYYVAAASALGVSGLALESAQAALVLRGLQLGFGIAQLAAIHAALRLLFPGRSLASALALLFAAALPMQTALFQLVGNETLAMPLVSLCSLLALRELRRRALVPGRWALVGAALGAALLAKASAALLVVPLLLALGFEARTSAPARRAALTSAAALLAAASALSAWHYARMAWLYGSPFAANWDAALSFTWWQDPGYRVAGDYLHGLLDAIADPWWAAFTSVPGGLWSTAFGDALFGGQRALLFAPPWNHRWLACAGVLALAPTALIAAGALRAIRRARGDAAWLYLVALAAITSLALLAMPLRVPTYTTIKAHFGHAALLPACAFLALGCEWLRASRLLRMAIGSIVALWAAVSLAGVWISPNAAATHAVLGHHALAQRDPERALAAFERALALDPKDARFAAGALDALRAHRRASAGLGLCDAAFRERGEASLRAACAAIFAAGGNPERAELELLRARAREPDDLRSASALAKLYLRYERSAEAAAALREWLRIRPHDLEAHLALAKLALADDSPERLEAALAPVDSLDPGNRRAADLRAQLRDRRPDLHR